jgi:regulator of replication initiation timing
MHLMLWCWYFVLVLLVLLGFMVCVCLHQRQRITKLEEELRTIIRDKEVLGSSNERLLIENDFLKKGNEELHTSLHNAVTNPRQKSQQQAQDSSTRVHKSLQREHLHEEYDKNGILRTRIVHGYSSESFSVNFHNPVFFKR